MSIAFDHNAFGRAVAAIGIVSTGLKDLRKTLDAHNYTVQGAAGFGIDAHSKQGAKLMKFCVEVQEFHAALMRAEFETPDCGAALAALTTIINDEIELRSEERVAV